MRGPPRTAEVSEGIDCSAYTSRVSLDTQRRPSKSLVSHLWSRAGDLSGVRRLRATSVVVTKLPVFKAFIIVSVQA
jgi:hypothetical protein